MKVEVEYSVGKSRSVIVRARITEIVLDWGAWNHGIIPTSTLYEVRNVITLYVGSNSKKYTYYEFTGPPDLQPYDYSGTRDETPNDWVSYYGSGGLSVKIKTRSKVYIYLTGWHYPKVISTIGIP